MITSGMNVLILDTKTGKLDYQPTYPPKVQSTNSFPLGGIPKQSISRSPMEAPRPPLFPQDPNRSPFPPPPNEGTPSPFPNRPPGSPETPKSPTKPPEAPSKK